MIGKEMKERYEYLQKILRQYSFQYLKVSNNPLELLEKLKEANPDMIMVSEKLDLLAGAIVYYYVKNKGLNGRGGITAKNVATYFDTKPQSITQKTFDVSMYLDDRASGEDEVYEFVDKDRFEVNEMYWNFLDSESGNDSEKSIQKLKEIIKKDPNFFDPYITLHEYYFSENKAKEAFEILTKGYDSAMKLIFKKDRFPDKMIWGFTENRHIIRIMFTYATLVWLSDDKKKALAIMLKLLHLNPNDNIGARYYVLALLEDYDCAEDVDEMFDEQFDMDVMKIEEWFYDKAEKHREALGWWLELEE